MTIGLGSFREDDDRSILVPFHDLTESETPVIFYLSGESYAQTSCEPFIEAQLPVAYASPTGTQVDEPRREGLNQEDSVEDGPLVG